MNLHPLYSSDEVRWRPVLVTSLMSTMQLVLCHLCSLTDMTTSDPYYPVWSSSVLAPCNSSDISVFFASKQLYSLSQCTVSIYLHLFSRCQDLFIQLSCWLQQAKNSAHYCLPVTSCLAGQHRDSVTSAYVRMSRNISPSYCIGATQYMFPLFSPPS